MTVSRILGGVDPEVRLRIVHRGISTRRRCSWDSIAASASRSARVGLRPQAVHGYRRLEDDKPVVVRTNRAGQTRRESIGEASPTGGAGTESFVLLEVLHHEHPSLGTGPPLVPPVRSRLHDPEPSPLVQMAGGIVGPNSERHRSTPPPPHRVIVGPFEQQPPEPMASSVGSDLQLPDHPTPRRRRHPNSLQRPTSRQQSHALPQPPPRTTRKTKRGPGLNSALPS